eukprot:1213734-Pyramimonas_sp.AAC.1
MQGPWKPTSMLFERGAAHESGQGRAEEARMQGYPWEGRPSLLCGFTVYANAARELTVAETDHAEVPRGRRAE